MATLFGIGGLVTEWVAALWLPGYLASRLLVPSARGLERHALSLVAGLVVVPTAWLLIAVGLSRPLTPALVWALSATTTLVAGALIGPRTLWRDPQLGRAGSAVALGALLASAVLALGFTPSLAPGDVLSAIQHCLYVIVAHAVGNDPSHGVPFYDQVSGEVLHLLVHHDATAFNGLGKLFAEQRLGNAAIIAPHVSLFGTAGWFTPTIHALAALGLTAGVAARAAGAPRWASAVAAVWLVWAVQQFLGYQINENLFVCVIVAALLWFAVANRWRPGEVLWTGLLCGLLIGLRHTAVLFWPAVLLAFACRSAPRGRTAPRLLLGCAAVVLAAAPWLYVNHLMLGSWIAHPRIHSPEDRAVMHELFGVAFRFKALNWPFADEVVRAPWGPFPSALWIPLRAIAALGILGGAVAAWGTAGMLGGRRRALAFAAALAVPHTIAIAWVELLDLDQLTYATPGLVPLALPLAFGLASLSPSGVAWRAWLATAAAAGVIAASVVGIRDHRAPADPRWIGASQMEAEQLAPLDSGGEAAARHWTRLRWLPAWPPRQFHLPPLFADAANTRRAAPLPGPLPTYASGAVAILAGQADPLPNRYRFGLRAGPPRAATAPVRTADQAVLIALTLDAAAVGVEVEREGDRYRVDVEVLEAATAPGDFSFWISTWTHTPAAIDVRLGGTALAGLARHRFGHEVGAHGGRAFANWIVTNYPDEVLGVAEVPFAIDPPRGGRGCGLVLFTAGATSDGAAALRGGHVTLLGPADRGHIVLPRHILAERATYYTLPWCAVRTPAPGDAYGVAEGPFEPSRPLRFRLDGTL